jgi:hypothetical protein
MRISRDFTTGLVLTLLMSGACVAANSLLCAAEQDPEPAMMLTPCALLTPEVAKRLPWFIKPGDVLCMSVTSEDVQVSERARLLLNELGGRLQSEGRFSNATAEYDRGIAAYAEGRYIEAVSHLQAAISSSAR